MRAKIIIRAENSNTSSGTTGVTDMAIHRHCGDPVNFEWLLVTDGNNWYSPDAFDFLPPNVDLVLMNFYSRCSIHNAVRRTNTPNEQNCCLRLENFQCTVSDPKMRSIDRGAVIFRYRKYHESQISFTPLNQHQPDELCDARTCGCRDGLMVEYLTQQKGWSFSGHPVDVCTMHHNANPKSCEMIGGTWYDHVDDIGEQQGCYYELPMPLDAINYRAYTTSRAACVC